MASRLHVGEAGQQIKMSGFFAHNSACALRGNTWTGGFWSKVSRGSSKVPISEPHASPFPSCTETREGTVPGTPPTHFSCLPAPALARKECLVSCESKQAVNESVPKDCFTKKCSMLIPYKNIVFPYWVIFKCLFALSRKVILLLFNKYLSASSVPAPGHGK